MGKPCVVMKFGGTSVANLERIRLAAAKIAAEYQAGAQVVVVVSAMAGVTNHLVDLLQQANPLAKRADADTVLATGEQVNAGLMAAVLQQMGLKARAWLGWQIPILTNDDYSQARILDIPSSHLQSCLNKGQIAVVAGFQGVHQDSNRITTLGRGGSDVTAVALAAALSADRCDIYTDVDGVYTTDPRIVPTARRIRQICYEEMLEYASLGAKVLQTRSVEMAMLHNVKLRVLSSMIEGSGTIVCQEEEVMEQKSVAGVAYAGDEVKFTLQGIPDIPGRAALVFAVLAEGGVNVDMIVQNRSTDGKLANLTFTAPKSEQEHARHLIEQLKEEAGYASIVVNDNVAKVSVIGLGMRANPGIAALMFKTLADCGVNIQVITTSEIKISVLIAQDYVELAVRALHKAFDLDIKPTVS